MCVHDGKRLIYDRDIVLFRPILHEAHKLHEILNIVIPTYIFLHTIEIVEIVCVLFVVEIHTDTGIRTAFEYEKMVNSLKVNY